MADASASFTPEETAAFERAIAQFDAREFYACHDTLEALWMEAMEPQRTFLQGILQLGVGYYHLLNGNWRGAALLWGEGLSRLDTFRPDYLGIDVEHLCKTGYANLKTLQTLGAERVAEFPLDRIPQIGKVA